MIRRMVIGVVLICIAFLPMTGCGGEEAPAGSSEAGEKLFKQAAIGNQAGCVSCHSLDPGVILVGPSLAGIGSLAGERVSGLSAEDYLRQSIIEPNTFVVEGFTANIMPLVWSDELSDEQVNNLVAFLLTIK